MATEEEKVISIRVKTDTNEKALGQLESNLKRVQKSRAELLKQAKTHSGLNAREEKELGRLSNMQQKLSGRITDRKKNLKSLVQAQKTAANSYDSLTQRNAKLAKSLRALGDPLGKNKAQFQKLSAEIKKNTGTLSEMDAAQGRHQRNVGNYTDALGTINPALGGMITQLKGATKAALAFVATPLGAILAGIVALAAPLVAFFTKSQKGMDMLSEATAGLTAFLDVFIDRLITMGEGMVDFLSGDFEKGIEKITGAFEGMGDEIEREVAATIKLEKELNKLADDRTAQTVKSAALQQQIAEKRAEAAEFEEKDAARSAKLIREAIDLAKELSEAEADLDKRKLSNILALEDLEFLSKEEQLRLRINQVKKEGRDLTIEELGLSNSNREDLEEANDLLAQIINTETSYAQAKRKFTKELNTLDKKAALQNKKNVDEFKEIRIDAEHEFFAEKKSLLTDSIEEEEALVNDGIDREIAAQEQKNKDLAEMDRKRMNTAVTLAQATASTLSAISTQSANKQIRELERQRDQNVITETQYQNKANDVRKQDFDNQKKLQIVQASINAAVAISRAFADYQYPASVAIAGLAGAAAGVQIGAISSTEYVPVQFAEGGLLQGASHANGGIPMTVNGQSGFEAEGGEAIINKKSTGMFLPLLSAINQAGGGVGFDNPVSLSKFAVGGITPNVPTNGLDIGKLVNSMNARIDRIKVTNVATDTASVANRVNNIQSNASFG